MSKKRLANILLFVVLMIVPFIVKAEDTYEITIQGSNNHHRYEVYQIFTGTPSDNHLSNIAWGSNVNTTTLAVAYPDYADPIEASRNLATESEARAFANLINGYLTTPAYKSCTIQISSCTISGIAGGYYLIKDVDDSLDNTNDVYTPYILSVLGDKTIVPKINGIPYVQHNFIVNNNPENSISATIGHALQSQISVQLPDDYTSYSAYSLVVYGDLANSFNFNPTSISVKVGDNTLAATSYTVAETATGFSVTFSNLKSLAQITDNSTIYVNYNVTLNENAVYGYDGNINSAHIAYTNNANEPTALTGLSSNIEAYVYTGKIEIHNVDEDGSPLAGATYSMIDSSNNAIVGVVDASDGSIVSIVGLGSGTYTLKQTTPPSSYEQHEDVTITITVDEYSGEITVDSISDNDILIFNEGEYTVLQIGNKYSALLAFTGGRGTLMYTVTGLTVMGLAILLILVRKRKDDIEDN